MGFLWVKSEEKKRGGARGQVGQAADRIQAVHGEHLRTLPWAPKEKWSHREMSGEFRGSGARGQRSRASSSKSAVLKSHWCHCSSPEELRRGWVDFVLTRWFKIRWTLWKISLLKPFIQRRSRGLIENSWGTLTSPQASRLKRTSEEARWLRGGKAWLQKSEPTKRSFIRGGRFCCKNSSCSMFLKNKEARGADQAYLRAYKSGNSEELTGTLKAALDRLWWASEWTSWDSMVSVIS